jgi:hypothetical protein
MFLSNYRPFPSTTAFLKGPASGSGSLLLATMAALLIFSTPAAASLTSTTQPVGGGTQNPVTFAQLSVSTLPGDFVITDTGVRNTFTVSDDLLDTFLYTNIPGLPPGLSGVQNATLTLNLISSTHATVGGGNLVEGNFSGSFSIIRTTPASNGQSNLLSGTFSNATISGLVGARSATFSESSILDPTFVLTSGFISISNALEEDFSLALTGMSAALSVGPGGFISSATAMGTGTFDSNPPPQVLPEPGSIFPMGAGLLGLAWFASRHAAGK